MLLALAVAACATPPARNGATTPGKADDAALNAINAQIENHLNILIAVVGNLGEKLWRFPCEGAGRQRRDRHVIA